jgi:hypothetical protein
MKFANLHIASTPRSSKSSRSTRRKEDNQALVKKENANDEANEIEYFREEMANEGKEYIFIVIMINDFVVFRW